MNQVENYYDTDPTLEWERLNRHRTELAVTLRALDEYLPPAPAKIADIGGGPGRYAIELTRKGYSVTLVDLSQQTAYAFTGDEMVRSFVVSTGTWMHPTVTGSYSIYVKYRYADMYGPDYYLPDVPYVMYFYKGYGLHGTYWHNNFGVPMSHGCVNFTTEDAGWVFDFTRVGTIVNVHD